MALIPGDEHSADGERVTGNHGVHAADRRAGAMEVDRDPCEMRGRLCIPRQTRYTSQELIEHPGQVRRLLCEADAFPCDIEPSLDILKCVFGARVEPEALTERFSLGRR